MTLAASNPMQIIVVKGPIWSTNRISKYHLRILCKLTIGKIPSTIGKPLTFSTWTITNKQNKPLQTLPLFLWIFLSQETASLCLFVVLLTADQTDNHPNTKPKHTDGPSSSLHLPPPLTFPGHVLPRQFQDWRDCLPRGFLEARSDWDRREITPVCRLPYSKKRRPIHTSTTGAQVKSTGGGVNFDTLASHFYPVIGKVPTERLEWPNIGGQRSPPSCKK